MPLSPLARLWLELRRTRLAILISSSLAVLMFVVVFENRLAQLAALAKVNHLESIPDAQLTGYDPGWFLAYASKLTPAGREYYVHSILMLDLIFPVVYGLWFMSALSFAYSALGPLYLRFRFVALVPLHAVMFDYVENLLLFQLMSDFPNGLSDQTIDIASICTQLKWFTILLSFVAILVGIVTSIRYVRKTRPSHYRPQ